MMQCKRFRLEALRNEEWFQYYSEFTLLVDRYTAAALDIATLYGELMHLYAGADAALDLARKSNVTDLISEADETRDNLFRGLADAIKSGLNHYDPIKQEAARHLTVLFEQHGNVAGKSYDEETAALHSLVEAMRGPYAADVTLLELNEWVNHLAEDNKKFEALIELRYAEEDAQTPLRMTELRKAADQVYRSILNRLDALILINGEAAYASFVQELGLRVDRFANLIAQRKGRNESAQKSQTREQHAPMSRGVTNGSLAAPGTAPEQDCILLLPRPTIK